MTNYAVLNTNGEIINTIVADSLDIAQEATKATCVELPESGIGIGDSYDGTQFINAIEVTPDV